MHEEEKDISPELDYRKIVRLNREEFEKAEDVYSRYGITSSQAIRLFIQKTAEDGRMPFRVTDVKNGRDGYEEYQKEAAFVSDMIGLKGVDKLSQEERMLRAIFGERIMASDISDDELREWGLSVGLPAGLKLSTLEDLYDSGMFPDDVTVPVDIPDNSFEDMSDTERYLLHCENIRHNLKETFNDVCKRAIVHEYELDAGEIDRPFEPRSLGMSKADLEKKDKKEDLS